MDNATDQPLSPAADNQPVRSTSWLPEMRAGLTGVLLWCAFPPQSYPWLAWVALIPWFGVWVDHRQLSFKRTLRVALIGGLTFWLPAIQWVRLSDPSAWPGWLVMSLTLAVWWPIMAIVVRRLYVRNGWPLWVAFTAAWGFQEIGREYYMTGFPWYDLAHSQFRQTWLIQASDLGGATLLSLVMVALQSLAAEWFFGGRWNWSTAPRPWKTGVCLAAASLFFIIGYGQIRMMTARFTPGPTVAILQSDVPQSRRLTPDHEELLNVYRKMIQKVIKSGKPVDVIIWPETSFPYPIIVADPTLDEAGIKRVLGEYVPPSAINDWYQNRNESQALMDAWATQSLAPIIAGATAWDLSLAGFNKYNTAALFEPGQPAQFYYKMHLVPFGEYIPWMKTVPFIADLAPFPPDQRPNLKPGDRPRILNLKKRWNLAPLICFEDTVPHVVRRFFSGEGAANRVDLFLNISNDGWFRGSEEHEVHLAGSVFRCVESRRAMVRSVNTGISAIIDGNGQIIHELPAAVEEVAIEPVPIDSRFSPYIFYGDLSGIFSSLACVIGWFYCRKTIA